MRKVFLCLLSSQWFEDKYQEVENEEQQLKKLHALVDSLVNHRKGEFPSSVFLNTSSDRPTPVFFVLSLKTRTVWEHGSICQKHGHVGEL